MSTRVALPFAHTAQCSCSSDFSGYTFALYFIEGLNLLAVEYLCSVMIYRGRVDDFEEEEGRRTMGTRCNRRRMASLELSRGKQHRLPFWSAFFFSSLCTYITASAVSNRFFLHLRLHPHFFCCSLTKNCSSSPCQQIFDNMRVAYQKRLWELLAV